MLQMTNSHIALRKAIDYEINRIKSKIIVDEEAILKLNNLIERISIRGNIDSIASELRLIVSTT